MPTLNLTPRVDCSRGTPMGRNWETGSDFDVMQPLHLNRVPLDSGGYDAGGAYWGHGQPIFVAYDDAGEFMQSMRARNRAAAKAELRDTFPCAWFHGERNPVRCYDNRGATVDRFTVVYLDQPERGDLFAAIGMNAAPFHPQGFGQHCTASDGPHLGARIKFTELPADCQKLVYQDRS